MTTIRDSTTNITGVGDDLYDHSITKNLHFDYEQNIHTSSKNYEKMAMVST